MRKQIPNNNISKDYEGVLNAFIAELIKAESNNVVSIFLTGSFARGEANDSSDLDIWCIFQTLNPKTLTEVGNITHLLPLQYNDLEMNAQCLTAEEFASCYFSKILAYPIIYFEAILLWGEDVAPKEAKSMEIEKVYKEILAEVLLSIRHYIAVKEPVEKLTYNKIKAWVLKPMMFALRLERYHYTKQYPFTKTDLLNAYNTPLKSIHYFIDEEKWNTDIQNNCDETLADLCKEVEIMLHAE